MSKPYVPVARCRQSAKQEMAKLKASGAAKEVERKARRRVRLIQKYIY